jgi:hypothetical protein
MPIRAPNLGRGFTCRMMVHGRCRTGRPTTTENARGLGVLTSDSSTSRHREDEDFPDCILVADPDLF